MRFINTTSLEFREVSGLDLSRLKNGYAVLSHRWTLGNDEIQFADVVSKETDLRTKDGYAKFAGACALAKTLGYDLLWIDTCCINKANSTELSEAINSMYRWYAESRICIAYLQDVTTQVEIRQSEWFNRGWTLQELIAPASVRFYSGKWNYLGDKASLSELLISKTGVPADILKGKGAPQTCSIAQRMSWAAKRTTTRVEDRAYSLMGLFDVNMPMIYGEREQAFMRLQEHIIAKSTDESIFVWSLDLLEDSTRDAKQVHCGLLATSPACFAKCGDVVATGRSRGFRINQFGLSISVPAAQHSLRSYCAPLKVTKEKQKGQCALFLSRLPEGDSFARTSSSTGESITMTETIGKKLIEFTVPLEPKEAPVHLYPGFWLRKIALHDPQISRYRPISRGAPSNERLTLPEGEFGTAGLVGIELQSQHHSTGWLKFGFDSNSNPVCFLTFPTLEADTNDPERVLIPEGFAQSPTGANHAMFNDEWLRASNRTLQSLPDYSYDSRLGSGNIEDGFDFTFKAPLFEISVSATEVPEMASTNSRKTEVWAVNNLVGKEPVQYSSNDSGCCC